MKLLVVCAFVCSVVSAQTHPYSNAWSYVTTAETASGDFTATTVTGTGGTDSHTIEEVAVTIVSPTGRVAAGFDYPAWYTGQATAYLPLCGPNGCEDGLFQSTSTGTKEKCGVTQQVLLVTVALAAPLTQPFVRWEQISASPTAIARRGGRTEVTTSLRSSVGCSGTFQVGITALPSPSDLRFGIEGSTEKPVTLSGNSTASTIFAFSTAHDNPTIGSIAVTAAIEASPRPCRVVSDETKSTTIKVD